jgi:1,4-alpha-glucan branching enzyme
METCTRRARPAGILAALLAVLLVSGCRPTPPAPQTPPPSTPTPCPQTGLEVTLRLEADPAYVDRVQVIGELPGAPLTMRAGQAGRWSARASGLVRGRRYRYLFRVHRKDLGRWVELPDPRAWMLDASRRRWSLLRAGHGAPRRPPAVKARPLGELIIYELNPREFVRPTIPFAHPTRNPDARGPGEVLRRITARIRAGYFNELGVNALELMPLMASAWTSHQRPAPERDPWGYLPLSWYALNGDFGAPEDLAALVRAAHQRGLLVLLDLSLDHGYGGGDHGLLTDLWPGWRKVKTQNPWGLLELRLDAPGVRPFLVGALRRLLVDYNLDGLRLDWTEKVPSATWAYFTAQARRLKPGALLISENPVRTHVTQGGFDGTWDFFFQWEAPLLLRQVYSNHDGINGRTVNTQAKLVENLTSWRRGPHAPPGPLVRYIESHDLPRIARPRVRWQIGGDGLQDVDGDGRKPDWLEGGGMAASRLGAVLLATVPGAIMIYAGQEHGADDDLSWSYDPLDWTASAGAPGQRLRGHYSRLLRLRARRPELRSDDLRVLVNDTARHLLVYSRGRDPTRADDDTAVVVLSFSNKPRRGVRVPLPAPGAWRDQLTGRSVTATSGQARVDLPPLGAALLLKGPATRKLKTSLRRVE